MHTAAPPDEPEDIRVLVVDDSACVREALCEMLERDRRMKVVGQAASGIEALAQVKALRPDVVTMDFQMPDMNGIEATRRIMEECPTPIVLVSAVLNPQETSTLFLALDAGALTLLEKPRLGNAGCDASVAHLVETVRLMSEVKVVRRLRRAPLTPPVSEAGSPGTAAAGKSGAAGAAAQDSATHLPYEILCIGASTGGPQALEQLLAGLDPAFPWPVLVVQHIASGFLQGLVTWLNQTSRLPVRIATPGQLLQQGVVYFAPDKRHMNLTRSMSIALEDSPPEESVKPSVNKLFRSCAAVFGRRGVGVLLTGMGRDGAAGLQAMKRSGAMTIVQDEASCIVFGMPGQAVKLGAATKVLPLQSIAGFLNWLALGRSTPSHAA
ncbi:putative response regulator receiver modulated CheB methylesterase [Megalodesulfovibrio gigas DSM 1382 = ATCC 19364]|uniref:Protein-glutamate methylesterase/protein-glutamine glutaminase n=1 Tax=Megalodesulfovibrio gigas (strain ATCC 19364 / DSM 1382 / NCIMB 9332 / VKM B-1759) TaxID=1121448 RepID=T2GC24_MEGG1|nr:putative response regulator receiver modulated CheB methylesterase [Megalodesulfovibrio gigas DSM 1382 = ATCC 19364]